MATSSSTETFTTLSNHTAIINQSKAKNMKTALGHVNRMLQMYPYVISEENSEQNTPSIVANCFEALPENAFEPHCEFLGRFSGYIKDHVPSITRYNTHVQYLSGLHNLIIAKYPSKESEMASKYTDFKRHC